MTLVIFFVPAICTSQEVIATSGNYSSNSGIHLSLTIGETIIETFEHSETVLTQGFHQPQLTITAINNLPFQNQGLKVYPNPTSDYVDLEITTDDFENLQYSLFDLSGKLLLRKKILTTHEQFNMEPFATGTYLFKVTNHTGYPLQTFKIIKK